jgi:DNA polymerase III subunit alpha
MGLDLLGPDVNESRAKFSVNNKGAIRFGMAAIKGVGEAAVQAIVEEREAKGTYTDIFEFAKRVNLRTVNKKNLEGLAISGAFDGFKCIKRSQFFESVNGNGPFIEELIKYGNKLQDESGLSQQNLFGGASQVGVKKPDIPVCEEWEKIDMLNKEKELVGVYLSAHPLDDYKLEIQSFCNVSLAEFQDLKPLFGRELKIAGIVVDAEHRTTKNGKPFGSLTIEDYTSSYKMTFFGNDYLDLKKFFTKGYQLVMRGKVQHRFGNPDGELEFKPSSTEMLSEIKDKVFNSIAIKIPVDQISDNLITEVQQLAESNKGNCMLEFLIYEPSTKVWIKMFSRTHKVSINKDLVNYLEKKSGLQYKIF